ncbi:ABC transporter ATP-binding protein [Siccirubricoccus sp. G192]|uniref:ABC transporter ATP-binding protein n=1 Tax=Siccirubricoccus sp. G192 TaxID=2849651 RepID=UPI001C2BA8AC|nr:ABC transporter ATP-binding protein [Siccirubricoccus sp. G192]MBV1795717.1 ABC transporter ATP-binding protein [Siccirubricoccus sp. G192]
MHRETSPPILTVKDLTVAFGPMERPARAVAGLNLTLQPGEILGIAGESGSGKSTLCNAIIRTLPRSARVGGEVRYDGRQLLALSEREMRGLRGSEISMVLQNPMTSLDPLFTIGNQVDEVLRERRRQGQSNDQVTAIGLLRRVHLTAPELRLRQYPHQLSGGMRQRVLTAMATAATPRLLIADEPTTALDASIQDEILLLFREIRDRAGTAIIIVTHDLSAIRRLSDRIIVMYAGRLVEEGPTATVFSAPRHPYTRALLDSLPQVEGDTVTLKAIPGQVPNLAELPHGCAFADRCPVAIARCRTEDPTEMQLGLRHRAFCWLADTAS